MPSTTLLGLSLDGDTFELPEFACRGITMTMEPIESAATIRRDVNGNLVNLSSGFEQFRKYRFQLSCDDVESPGFAAMSSESSAIWPGDEMTLICVPELGATEQQTFTAMVMAPGWQVSRDEYGAVTSWSLNLEQV